MDYLFDLLENFYDNFPLSLQTVGALMAIFCVAFAFGFRELWVWYSKIGLVRRDMRDIQIQMSRLEMQLKELALSKTPGTDVEGLHYSSVGAVQTSEAITSPETDSKKNVFPLNH